jgi:type II secretory pathway component PulC
MTSPRRHFWIFHLVTILICAFFAARATGRLVAGIVLERLPVSSRPAIGSTTLTPDAPPASARAIDVVVTRNIFCSACEPIAPTPASEGAGAAADGAPTKTSLKLRLLATLVRDDDPRASVAFIVDTETAQTGVFGVGDKLADGVSVLEIALRQVLIRNAGRQELLTLGDGEAEPMSVAKGKDVEPGPFNRPEPLDGLEGISNGIRHVAEKRYAIERGTFNKVLADSRLFTGVRAIPSMKDGQLIGFAVYAKVGSIPSLLGLFSGDVIQAVNGQAVTTPEKALEVLQGMRGSSQISLSFQRRGVPLTHDYLIR